MKEEEIHRFVMKHIHSTGRHPTLKDLISRFGKDIDDILSILETMKEYYDIKVIPKPERFGDLIKYQNE